MPYLTILIMFFALTIGVPVVSAQMNNQENNQNGMGTTTNTTQTQDGTWGSDNTRNNQNQNNQNNQMFQGRVLAVESDTLTLQDLSTGMTTSYTVRDAAILRDVKPGDEVSVQTGSGNQATNVQKNNQ